MVIAYTNRGDNGAGPTDEALVADAKVGDMKAFEALVRRYERPLFNYIRRFVGNVSDAEDIFQDTFVRVHGSLWRFRVSSPFKPWLYCIASNRCIDLLRRRQRTSPSAPGTQTRENRTDASSERPPRPDANCATSGHTALSEILEAAIRELRPKVRAVYLMARYESIPHEEIAGALRIDTDTVKLRINKAVKHLLKAIEEEGPTNAPTPGNRETRELLRAYLLDTLPPGRHEEVIDLIEREPAWQQAREVEREALGKLDSALDAAPSAMLAPNTMECIAKERSRRRSRAIRHGVYIGLALITIAELTFVLAPVWYRNRMTPRAPSTRNSFERWELAMRAYAKEDPKGLFPCRTRYDDLWTIDIQSVYPEYLEPIDLVLPSESGDEVSEMLIARSVDWPTLTRLLANDVIYTGWVIRSANEARLAIMHSDKLRDAESRSATEVALPEGTLYRLREGVENLCVSGTGDPSSAAITASKIPVLVQNNLDDPADGSAYFFCVLFLDGHVEIFTPNSGDDAKNLQETFRLFSE